MTDGGSFSRKFCSDLRLSGTHQAPCVDEDLTVNLLGNCFTILLNGAGARSRNTRAQIQISRVLRGSA